LSSAFGLAFISLVGKLAHAVVVEEHRRTPFGDKHRDTVADDQGFGVIDLEAVAVDECDGEGLKGSTPLEGTEGFVEVLWGHAGIMA
jgi:hypothetical protein